MYDSFNDSEEYFAGLAGEVAEELAGFEKHILPVFEKRGYNKNQALNYFANKMITEAIDCLSIDITNANNDDGDNKDAPWKNQ